MTQWQALKLPQADIALLPGLVPPATADAWLAALLADVPWQQRYIRLFGRRVLQPRLLCWMGEPDARYRYSGQTLLPVAWQPVVNAIRAAVEAACGTRFNSVLLNLYRNGQDHMGWHADDERELGAEPVIASLSLGARRAFRLRPRDRDLAPPQTIELAHGSLLCMRGQTQRHWQHSVPKRQGVHAARINLTFRRIHATP